MGHLCTVTAYRLVRMNVRQLKEPYYVEANRGELACPTKKCSNIFHSLIMILYDCLLFPCLQQIAPNGWAEGECRGKAGWFPAAYVERRENIPPNKVFPQA